MKAARFSHFGGPEVLEIVVCAAGVNASDWKKRLNLMDMDLPQTLGYEAAGIIDELGEGETLPFATASSAFVLAERPRLNGPCCRTTRQSRHRSTSLTWLRCPPPSSRCPSAGPGVVGSMTVLINGASGNIGGAASRLAVARGARVIGTPIRAADEGAPTAASGTRTKGRGVAMRRPAAAQAIGVHVRIDGGLFARARVSPKPRRESSVLPRSPVLAARSAADGRPSGCF